MTERPQKITFGEMREMGARGSLVYCADYRCSHSISPSSGDGWPDDVRLSDIEARFVCQARGKRAALQIRRGMLPPALAMGRPLMVGVRLVAVAPSTAVGRQLVLRQLVKK